mmetsp:Transcript_14954/g.22049  ORF Transcript_14954/g.22049 Transcript_14954/m.22049 type:complete len:442 (-) Transcript_14954:222-1547(-)
MLRPQQLCEEPAAQLPGLAHRVLLGHVLLDALVNVSQGGEHGFLVPARFLRAVELRLLRHNGQALLHHPRGLEHGEIHRLAETFKRVELQQVPLLVADDISLAKLVDDFVPRCAKDAPLLGVHVQVLGHLGPEDPAGLARVVLLGGAGVRGVGAGGARSVRGQAGRAVLGPTRLQVRGAGKVDGEVVPGVHHELHLRLVARCHPLGDELAAERLWGLHELLPDSLDVVDLTQLVHEPDPDTGSSHPDGEPNGAVNQVHQEHGGPLADNESHSGVQSDIRVVHVVVKVHDGGHNAGVHLEVVGEGKLPEEEGDPEEQVGAGPALGVVHGLGHVVATLREHDVEESLDGVVLKAAAASHQTWEQLPGALEQVEGHHHAGQPDVLPPPEHVVPVGLEVVRSGARGSIEGGVALVHGPHVVDDLVDQDHVPHNQTKQKPRNCRQC